MKYYPAFIDLKDKPTVVIGGGRVAERKVRSLLQAGAQVRVISPEITEGLAKLRKQGLLKHVKRTYRKGDLKNAFMVIAGTSSSTVNKKIAEDAEYLVNVIDAPLEGNFIVPSLIRKGALTIAISTEGTSPAVSRKIRKEIETLYGKEYSQYLKFLETVRQKTLTTVKDSRKRKRILNYLASDNILHLLRNKGLKETCTEIKIYLETKTDKL
ncbi:MAG: bifunctional precorrin-2 dehydrogenase/sirohydrochlorin ferrochelatase [Nitrospiraceae bacterium]|nr:MAG: bifunctional precorrin-2 dehydrogenase/sirohydrochlorin ferrochelatase [Nitrospiraceae bacterium]